MKSLSGDKLLWLAPDFSLSLPSMNLGGETFSSLRSLSLSVSLKQCLCCPREETPQAFSLWPWTGSVFHRYQIEGQGLHSTAHRSATGLPDREVVLGGKNWKVSLFLLFSEAEINCTQFASGGKQSMLGLSLSRKDFQRRRSTEDLRGRLHCHLDWIQYHYGEETQPECDRYHPLLEWPRVPTSD